MDMQGLLAVLEEDEADLMGRKETRFSPVPLTGVQIEVGQQSGCFLNIARGTTDPEIDSVTWIKLGNNMAPLTLVENLATRWRHLHSSKFGH